MEPNKPAKWATDLDRLLTTLCHPPTRAWWFFANVPRVPHAGALHPGLYSVARLRGLKTKLHVPCDGKFKPLEFESFKNYQYG